MAKLISDELELEFRFLGHYKYDFDIFEFKCTCTWNGVPILNEAVMKRKGSYWKKGETGGLVAEEQENFTLIEDFEAALNNKEVRIWESWPDPDMCISIYPDCCFPCLNKKLEGYYSIIVSPDSYQFKDSECYGGFEGVSFVMIQTTEQIQEFVCQLKKEFIVFGNKKEN